MFGQHWVQAGTRVEHIQDDGAGNAHEGHFQQLAPFGIGGGDQRSDLGGSAALTNEDIGPGVAKYDSVGAIEEVLEQETPVAPKRPNIDVQDLIPLRRPKLACIAGPG
nr:hypothetical protein [Pseudaminobacter soli]